MPGLPPHLYDGPVVPLSRLRSRAPEGLRVGGRIDPYWADFWPVGQKASWVGVRRMERQVAGGWARLPWWLAGRPGRMEGRLSGSGLGVTLRVVGALNMWQELSAEQLAAFTGVGHIAGGRSGLMADLFQLGLVEVGVHADALRRTDISARSNVYRLTRDGTVERTLDSITTGAERLAVTGGVTERALGGGMHDRHAVVTAELALRVAESSSSVAVVAGETVCRIGDLLGRPWHPRFTGDAVVVREDGLRVVVETTASTSGLDAKLARWTAALAQNPLRDSGLVVVFVTAENPNVDATVRASVRRRTYDAVRRAVRDTPGFPGNRTADRVGVVDWRDWFPAPGVASSWFESLNVWFPSGPPGSPWVMRSLADPFDVEFSPRFDAMVAVDCLSSVHANPVWLHRPSRLDPVIPRLAAEFGYRVEDLVRVRARGGVPAARLPARMVWGRA